MGMHFTPILALNRTIIPSHSLDIIMEEPERFTSLYFLGWLLQTKIAFIWRKYPPPSEIMPSCPALMGLGRRMWLCFCICICQSQKIFMLQHESCICDIVAAVTLRCSETQNNPNVVLQRGIMIWK